MKSEANNEYHRVQDDLKAWIDHELSPWRRFWVRRHLARCASCREEVQAMEQLHRDLRVGSDADAKLPPALRARILTQLGEAADRPPPLAEPDRPWLRRYGFATSLAVNAALVLVLVYTGVLREKRTDAPAPVAVTRAMSPPAAPQSQSHSGTETNKPELQLAAPRSHVPPVRIAGETLSQKAKTPALARPQVVPSAPTPVPDYAGAGSSVAAGTTPPPAAHKVSAAAPAPPITFAAKPAARLRMKTDTPVMQAPSLSAPPAAPAPASPAPPPAGSGRAGFGGGGFGGGGFGGAAGIPPQVQDAAPREGGPAPVRLGTPPAPAARAEAPLRVLSQGTAEQNLLSVDGAIPAKSAPGAKRADRSAPAPIGPWPTIALPPGVDPSAFGVKAVTVTWDVDEQGRVFHVVFKTTGDPQVDGAIRTAVHAGRYVPATRRGEPITAPLTHRFELVTPTKP